MMRDLFMTSAGEAREILEIATKFNFTPTVVAHGRKHSKLIIGSPIIMLRGGQYIMKTLGHLENI